MARAKWCGDAVYRAAAEFKDRCLIGDDSLFAPGTSAWTASHVERVATRIGAPGASAGSFIEKLEDQLAGLAAGEILVGAEILFMVLIPEADTGPAKRYEHLSRILAMMPEPVGFPENVASAVEDRGVANFAAGKAFRYAGLQFFGRLAVQVKAMAPRERTALFASGSDVAALVGELPGSSHAMYANAFLHMLYPEQFDYMISTSHRGKLVKAFSAAPGVAEAGDVDRQIARIRELADDANGEPIDLYANPLLGIWRESAPRRWQEAVDWADRLYGTVDFDVQEREYKLRIAAKARVARDALLSGDTAWRDSLQAAFSDGANNLTSWRTHGGFLSWCAENERDAAEAIRGLWQAPDATSAVHDFLGALPREAVAGAGTRLSIASFLLLAVPPTRLPFFKPTVYQDLKKLLALAPVNDLADVDPERMYRPEELAGQLGVDSRRVRQFLRDTFPRDEGERGKEWYLTPEQTRRVLARFSDESDPEAGEAVYADWIGILEELRLRMLASGTQMRDLLDAQGVAWWLVKGPVPEQWSAAERAAFESFRAGSQAGTEVEAIGDMRANAAGEAAVSIPPADSALADRLFLPQQWLQHVLDLLAEKRQMIFYGPPGTGKTFIAQRIGEHLAAHGGSCQLVQFHPSYTYEDFFEGYRPQADGEGALRFDLARGALRRIAEQAREQPTVPHLLIVDEINRGNIAKIFGELYFLLEYRGEAITLQYSPAEDFRLPENLLLIGTMNTADRSIALVDTALRRRFYFVGLDPTKQPVDQVLERWLAACGHPPEAALLLAELNRLMDSEDFAIGPSYFMGSRAPDLERVWAHSIVPLLEERYYGSGRTVASEFGLATLRSRLAAAADATGERSYDDSATDMV